ncbi:hypothetical protein CH63R_11088 [Colletotrichum higginsianum IMI 349063]|uniref:Uncharacterized protein n=1 Tax=Colletotrichum higginsianum (strain IMI 349063) TaxID=759273 RepID=A0A1B7XXA8_COLHI|nr:hypothetical protein CH63R_11088 [Colletotrichum higginsianum IMI 349063]OBR04385.1 hypothetical protein CH63R_11088 [Colletotrichum higginsianum IMI 349063]
MVTTAPVPLDRFLYNQLLDNLINDLYTTVNGFSQDNVDKRQDHTVDDNWEPIDKVVKAVDKNQFLGIVANLGTTKRLFTGNDA